MNDEKNQNQVPLDKVPPKANETTVLKPDHNKVPSKGDIRFKKFVASVLVGSSILLILIAVVIILVVFLTGHKGGQNPTANKIEVRAELPSENDSKSLFFDDKLNTKYKYLGDVISKQINPSYLQKYQHNAFIYKNYGPKLGIFIQQIYNFKTGQYVVPDHGGYFELEVNSNPSSEGVSSTLIHQNDIFDFILLP